MKILAGMAVVGMLGGVASAAYLSNGDFETAGTAGADFAAWSETGTNPGSVLTNGIAGHSLLLSATSGGTPTNGVVSQSITGSLGKAIIELDVALSAPTASLRTFNMFLRHTASTDQINLRVTDSDANGVAGDISIYNGTSWVNLLSNAVTISSSQSDLKVNHLRIEIDYPNGVYSIYATDANGNTVSSLNNSAFQITTTPVSASSTLQQVIFSTTNWQTNSWAVVDNVVVSELTVPEPAAVSTLAFAGGILLGYRRKSR